MTGILLQTGAVVIGRNEGERLLRCLTSLNQLVGKVVYVDSASSDGSAAEARRLGAEVVMLDMKLPFTAARARAQGFARIETLVPGLEYVMFVDGDCEVENGWLEVSAQFLKNHQDFAVVCGRRRELDPKASRYNASIDKEWDTPIGEAPTCGGDAMMNCISLREVGGFDLTMIAGEEPELCRRLRISGWRIMRIDAPMTIHDAAMTKLGQWWKRAIRSGFGYAQAWHRTRGDEQESPLYRRELMRAVTWAGILPLAALLLGVLVHTALLLLWPTAAAAQYLRVARREGSSAAALAVIGKYAELSGALRFLSRNLRGSAGGTISYK